MVGERGKSCGFEIIIIVIPPDKVLVNSSDLYFHTSFSDQAPPHSFSSVYSVEEVQWVPNAHLSCRFIKVRVAVGAHHSVSCNRFCEVRVVPNCVLGFVKVRYYSIELLAKWGLEFLTDESQQCFILITNYLHTF